jgi:hypothetical protein
MIGHPFTKNVDEDRETSVSKTEYPYSTHIRHGLRKNGRLFCRRWKEAAKETKMRCTVPAVHYYVMLHCSNTMLSHNKYIHH